MLFRRAVTQTALKALNLQDFRLDFLFLDDSLWFIITLEKLSNSKFWSTFDFRFSSRRQAAASKKLQVKPRLFQHTVSIQHIENDHCTVIDLQVF